MRSWWSHEPVLKQHLIIEALVGQISTRFSTVVICFLYTSRDLCK
jgi:hypothetical protein